MWENILGVFGIISAVGISLLLFFLIVGAPIAYLEGKAKADWLKQTQNIELPWYRAAFLSVNISNHTLNVGDD